MTKPYSISSSEFKSQSKWFEISDKSNWCKSCCKEKLFIWLSVQLENSFLIMLTQLGILSLSIARSFLKILELNDFQYFPWLLINQFLKNWVPIILRFLFFIVLLAKNIESKSNSLFSKFCGFEFCWFLFIVYFMPYFFFNYKFWWDLLIYEIFYDWTLFCCSDLNKI